MKFLLVTVLVVFGAVSSATADGAVPLERMALDVIQWIRHGNEKFHSKYNDQPLFAKKKVFVLYGKVFEQMAKEGKLPEGYKVFGDKDIKKIDWKFTGAISISDDSLDGGYVVHASLGPLGMSEYLITPEENGYRVRFVGGS
jgi:hypothetical protein